MHLSTSGRRHLYVPRAPSTVKVLGDLCYTGSMSTTEQMITTARHCLAYDLSRDEAIEQVVITHDCNPVFAFHAVVAAEILERHADVG